MKKKLAIIMDELWAGTEASLQSYLEIASAPPEMQAGMMAQDKEDDTSYLLDVQDGIGVIKIHGPLTNRDTWYNELRGITSYNEIRTALIQAASNSEVSDILLDINSGGGTANGVSDVANLIRLINDQVKSVTAFTDGAMMSAAYWLGCAAGEVYGTKMSDVGSIGVIATHMEYSKALKDDGVGVTVMRAGKYKALANSVEPLTEAAKAEIQKSLDAAYNVFVDHVAMMRGHTTKFVHENMAQGRTFFGEAALEAGLVDGIATFDKVVTRLREKSIDKSTQSLHNPRNLTQGVDNMKNKKALSAQEIAAMAEGVMPKASGDPTDTITETPEGGATPAAPALAASGEVAPVEAAAPAPAPAAAPAAAPAQASNELVTYLQAQVAEKDAALVDAKATIKGLTADLEGLQATVDPMKEIVGRSLNNMRIALGGTSTDISTMSVSSLIEEHKRLSTEFADKFKAGGVAAVDAAVASKGETKVPASHFARLAAVNRPTAKQ